MPARLTSGKHKGLKNPCNTPGQKGRRITFGNKILLNSSVRMLQWHCARERTTRTHTSELPWNSFTEKSLTREHYSTVSPLEHCISNVHNYAIIASRTLVRIFFFEIIWFYSFTLHTFPRYIPCNINLLRPSIPISNIFMSCEWLTKYKQIEFDSGENDYVWRNLY